MVGFGLNKGRERKAADFGLLGYELLGLRALDVVPKKRGFSGLGLEGGKIFLSYIMSKLRMDERYMVF